MKTMTCAEMGGPCQTEISAASFDELLTKGMEHVNTAHPEMAEDIKKMSKEDLDKWSAEAKAEWDAKPESM